MTRAFKNSPPGNSVVPCEGRLTSITWEDGVSKHGNGSEEVFRRIKKAQRLPRGGRLWSRRVVPYSAHDTSFSVLRNSKLGDSFCRHCARGWFSDRDVSVLAL